LAAQHEDARGMLHLGKEALAAAPCCGVHISPAIIGMGVGLFALLPRVGILDIEDMKRLNYLPVFFVAAAVSMGTVLEATKGLEVLTNYMFAWMQPFILAR
jgi:hypothetical protein